MFKIGRSTYGCITCVAFLTIVYRGGNFESFTYEWFHMWDVSSLMSRVDNISLKVHGSNEMH